MFSYCNWKYSICTIEALYFACSRNQGLSLTAYFDKIPLCVILYSNRNYIIHIKVGIRAIKIPSYTETFTKFLFVYFHIENILFVATEAPHNGCSSNHGSLLYCNLAKFHSAYCYIATETTLFILKLFVQPRFLRIQ